MAGENLERRRRHVGLLVRQARHAAETVLSAIREPVAIGIGAWAGDSIVGGIRGVKAKLPPRGVSKRARHAARHPARLRAGGPTRRKCGVRRRSGRHEHERRAVAIRRLGPRQIGAVGESFERSRAAVDELQRHRFAAVAESSRVLARDHPVVTLAVAILKSVPVPHHQHRCAGVDRTDRGAGKIIGNALREAQPMQIKRRCADVSQPHELEIVAIGKARALLGISRIRRMIHEFGNNYRARARRHGCGLKVRAVQRRPRHPVGEADACVHCRKVVECDRAAVHERSGCQAAARQARIGTVERVVNNRTGGRARGDRQLIIRRHNPAKLAEHRRQRGRPKQRLLKAASAAAKQKRPASGGLIGVRVVPAQIDRLARYVSQQRLDLRGKSVHELAEVAAIDPII